MTLNSRNVFGLSARVIPNIAVVVGLFVLARVIYGAASGALAAQLFGQSRGSWMESVYALGLSLPVPFHIISVGFILQKGRLSPFWARVAWLAVVVSGCWLGLALGIKVLVF